MSSHAFPKIDQKEYLKKYLSGDKLKKKKKDKKHKKSSNKDAAKVRIIDDDVNHLDTGLQIDEELLLTGEDAPQIVGEYIEDSPADKKVPKWKSIVIKDESDENESHPAGYNEHDIWGRKASEVRIKKEFSPDNSPHRRRDRKRKSPSSPPRRQHKSPKREKSSTRNREAYESPNRATKIKTEPLSPTLHKSVDKKIQNRNEDSYDASSSRRRRNSDQSPPRRRRNSSPRHNSPRHNSPTQNGRHFALTIPKRERNQTPDNAPQRRTNSSATPPRTKRHIKRSPANSGSHGRRNLHHSPARSTSFDQSPPRKYKSEFRSTTLHRKGCDQPASRGRSPDQSPPRLRQNIDQYSQRRHRRDSDQSPPRRRKHSSDVSPQRNHKQRTATPDNTPPRKSKKASGPSPTRKRRGSDQSPLRRQRKHATEARVKQEKRTPDSSPPRPARQSRWEKQEPAKSQSPPPTHKPKPAKTLEGKKAGLQNAQALQSETNERRKREDLLFETMSSEISGRNAEVQVRSTGRKGRRAREAADEDPEERRRKDEYEAKKKQQYDRWGKGLKQIEDHKNRMLQQEYESSKPLARYANDEDLERHLKDQERAEDPMLEYMRQKRKEKEKQSGIPEMPRYKGSYPENRFGIRPGYRWDGVDRSNGYEKKYFDVQNEKRARQDEAYKYSVEDM